MRFRSAFLYQVFGATLPALMMLLSIPFVRTRLDLDHFAAFTVLLSAVGLLGVLDGGLGRASTYFVSLALKFGSRQHIISVFHGVLAIGLLFSAALALSSAAGLQFFSGNAIRAARPALLILVCFTPVFVACSLFRGFLEAEQRFAQSSWLQLLHGAMIATAPVVIFAFSAELTLFAWTVGVARVALMLALMKACRLATLQSWIVRRATPVHSQRVFDYTKWLLLSNVVGLTIVFADRVFVATLFSSAIVAAYVLPMELIARVQILTTAFSSVLFPRLVSRHGIWAETEARALVVDAQGLIMAITAVLGFAASLAAEPAMGWWLGDSLALTSSRVIVMGVVGVGLIASASLAMLDLNSRGLTRPVAMLHLVEMPAYLVCLYFAAKSSSVTPLLCVWTGRLAIDAIGMSLIVSKMRPWSGIALLRAARRGWKPWSAVLFSLMLLSALTLQSGLLAWLHPTVVGFGGVGAAAFAGWHFLRKLRRALPAPHG